MLLAVLIQQIQDAVNAHIPTAVSYLFEDLPESKDHVFSFRHICQYFGYDIVVLRKKLLKLCHGKLKLNQRKMRRADYV